MQDVVIRVFEAEASKYPAWQQVKHLNWPGLLGGLVSRLRVVETANPDGLLISVLHTPAFSKAIGIMVAAAADRDWGYVVCIGNRRMTDFLRTQRRLLRVMDSAAPDGDAGGSSSGSPGDPQGGGSSGSRGSAGRSRRRIASREYQSRDVPLEAVPRTTALLLCNTTLEQQVDLQRAAAMVLNLLASFAVKYPEDAAILERKILEPEPDGEQDLAEATSVAPGTLRQRAHVARKRFIAFIGKKRASELRDLLGASQRPTNVGYEGSD